jgi:hypothetical protein
LTVTIEIETSVVASHPQFQYRVALIAEMIGHTIVEIEVETEAEKEMETDMETEVVETVR